MKKGNLRPVNPVALPSQSIELFHDSIDQQGTSVMSREGGNRYSCQFNHLSISGVMKNTPCVLSELSYERINELNMTMNVRQNEN